MSGMQKIKAFYCQLVVYLPLMINQSNTLTAWKELHDEIKIDRILKRIKHLDDPLVVSFY